MTNVAVVHGTFGKPFENWFPWLEAELTKKDIKCLVPQFPTPSGQSYENWEKLLTYYVSIGAIDSESILIGHSSGAPFLVKYLINNPTVIKGLITVSGFNHFVSGMEAFDNLNSDFYFEPNTEALNKSTKNVQCFQSDNDPYLPPNVLASFIESVGGKSHLVKDAGHFNADAGYKEFHQIMEFILM